jgi:hypothetical protein
VLTIAAESVSVTEAPDTAAAETVGDDATPDTLKALGAPAVFVSTPLIVKTICVESDVAALLTVGAPAASADAGNRLNTIISASRTDKSLLSFVFLILFFLSFLVSGYIRQPHTA